MFTVGSKNPENGKTICELYFPELKVKAVKRTTDNISVYAAEITAI